MGIVISKMPNFSRLQESLKSAIAAEMEKVAIDNKEEVITRTTRGQDAGGNSFQPYSKPYARFKSRKTKSNALKVNLTLTGRMLQSLQTGVQQRGTKIVARIFPASNKEAAKIRGNMQHRNFFAISKQQYQDFRDRINNVIGRKLK